LLSIFKYHAAMWSLQELETNKHGDLISPSLHGTNLTQIICRLVK